MGVNPFNFDRKVKANPGYSVHNMSYDYKFTCNPGELIPVYTQEVYPGDSIAYNNAFVVKSLPLTNPSMTDIYAYVHYWYVPYRLLQSHETIGVSELGDTNTFEDYINGIHEGLSIPYIAEGDTWKINNLVTSEQTTGNFAYCRVPAAASAPNSLFGLVDYLGLGGIAGQLSGVTPKPAQFVEQYPIRAYNAIWNTKYRDQNIQCVEYAGHSESEVKPGSSTRASAYGFNDGVCVGISLLNSNILRRNWVKDYFTSMLPWQQKGTPIALPVTSSLYSGDITTLQKAGSVFSATQSTSTATVYTNTTGSDSSISGRPISVTSTAFDINDLRLTNSVQKFLESNALSGTTYHQFCVGHFGISPRDETISEPMYLGGSKTPVLITEVTQTSSSDIADSTPQGTITGKAATADKNFIFKERFYEHGIVMGLFSIMPMPVYSGGVNRMWIKTDVYDWYSPEFAHLGEQPIYNQELNILTDSSETNALKTIGFQGRWSELRTRQNICTSGFISSIGASTGNYGGMADWTVQRSGTNMTLNSSFIVCKPDMKMFAFPDSKNFIVDFGNQAKMSRPIPALAEALLVG